MIDTVSVSPVFPCKADCLADQDILSGLLYYSQTATVIRVAQAHNELRGLIQTRNELARYMSLKTVKPATQPQPAEISIDEDEFDRMNQDDPIPEVEEHALLPDPIDQHRICKRCYANDACMLYRKVSRNCLQQVPSSSLLGRGTTNIRLCNAFDRHARITRRENWSLIGSASRFFQAVGRAHQP